MKKRKLRILVNTNAQWATSGYAIIVKSLFPRIRDAGFPLASSNFYGLEGGKIEYEGITQYPKMASAYGDDSLLHHSKDFKADISITMQDIWTMDPKNLQGTNRFLPVVPIDHNPTPPAVLERLKLAYRIVTYSKFGHDQIQKEGLYSTYIPCTVETDIFKPLGEKAQFKKELGIPEDLFVFGMIAANKDNPPRKSFQEAMDAFVMFKKKVPKSCMYFHTFLDQVGGFPIRKYAEFLGILGDIYFVPPYDLMMHIGRPELAKIYNSMDCLLAPSRNEGFGIPIIEAQSCGVPAIVNNSTSMPELVKPGETGYVCSAYARYFSPMLAYTEIPDTNSIYDCMMRVYNKDRVKMSENARKWILENFDAQTVFDTKWLPFFDRLEKEIYPNIDNKVDTK